MDLGDPRDHRPDQPRGPGRQRHPLPRRPRHRLHRHGPHHRHLPRGGSLRDGRRRLGVAGRRHRAGPAPGNRGLGDRRQRRLSERAAPGDEQPPLRVGGRRGPSGERRQPHALGILGQRERDRGRRGLQLPRARRPGRLRRGLLPRPVAHAAPDQTPRCSPTCASEPSRRSGTSLPTDWTSRAGSSSRRTSTRTGSTR